jgi:flagellar hook protein FlgE
VLTDLKIDTSNLKPNPTTKVDQTMNLNSAETNPTVATFSPTDTNSYNKTISTKVYDSQGNEHTMDQYYVKTGTNAWRVYT